MALTGKPGAKRQGLVSGKRPELSRGRSNRRQICQHGHGNNEGSHGGGTTGSLRGIVENLEKGVACGSF